MSFVDPQQGPASGGTKVRVRGHHFGESKVGCMIGEDVKAIAVEFVSDSELIGTTPPLPKPAAEDGCVGGLL